MRRHRLWLGLWLSRDRGWDWSGTLDAELREPSKRAGAELTQREREVLALVGRGLSNQEIAAERVLSPATTRTHVSRAMVKAPASSHPARTRWCGLCGYSSSPSWAARSMTPTRTRWAVARSSGPKSPYRRLVIALTASARFA